MTEPLTGDALKARVDELKPAPDSDLAIACGYVNTAGKANTSAFNKALLEAHGILPRATKSGRPGRGLSFAVKAGGKGQIVLSGGYGELVGIAPGENVEIKHVGNSLIVHAAGVVPVFRDEPVPAAVPTYDSATVQVA